MRRGGHGLRVKTTEPNRRRLKLSVRGRRKQQNAITAKGAAACVRVLQCIRVQCVGAEVQLLGGSSVSVLSLHHCCWAHSGSVKVDHRSLANFYGEIVIVAYIKSKFMYN